MQRQRGLASDGLSVLRRYVYDPEGVPVNNMHSISTCQSALNFILPCIKEDFSKSKIAPIYCSKNSNIYKQVASYHIKK